MGLVSNAKQFRQLATITKEMKRPSHAEHFLAGAGDLPPPPHYSGHERRYAGPGDYPPRRRSGKLKKVGALAMVVCALFGAKEVVDAIPGVDLSGFLNPFHTDKHDEYSDLVVRANTVTAEQNYCFAKQTSDPGLKLTKHRDNILFDDDYSTTITAHAETELCIDHTRTTRTVSFNENDKPVAVAYTIVFSGINTDIKEWRAKHDNSGADTVNPLTGTDFADIDSKAFDAVHAITAASTCNSYTAQVATSSAKQAFTGDAVPFGVPADKVTIDVQYDVNMLDVMPEGNVDNQDLEHRTGYNPGKSYKIEDMVRNCGEIAVGLDGAVIDLKWSDPNAAGQHQFVESASAGAPS